MASKSFDFGKNWQEYLKTYLNQERIEEAKRSIVEFCKGRTLKGTAFIDVGCGSGLFSLAAYQLSASHILSFDIDPDSVKCCESLRERAGKPENWRIMTGSILDENFVRGLGKFDLVYSWGVLHHTGNMWQAIDNTARLVDEKGLLYLAIYNKADGFGFHPDGRFGPSKFWLKIKRRYSSWPLLFQNTVDYAAMALLVLGYLVTLSNPVKKIINHKELRGMSWRIDIKDWFGGYPYDYASVDEIFHFVKNLGFSLENLKSNNGLRNNEYLFKKL